MGYCLKAENVVVDSCSVLPRGLLLGAQEEAEDVVEIAAVLQAGVELGGGGVCGRGMLGREDCDTSFLVLARCRWNVVWCGCGRGCLVCLGGGGATQLRRAQPSGKSWSEDKGGGGQKEGGGREGNGGAPSFTPPTPPPRPHPSGPQP